MATQAYQEILDQIQKLTPEEQQQLREDIDRLLSKQDGQKKRRSILEFRGIAKGFWKDVDIDKYIEEERRSWDKEWR